MGEQNKGMRKKDNIGRGCERKMFIKKKKKILLKKSNVIILPVKTTEKYVQKMFKGVIYFFYPFFLFLKFDVNSLIDSRGRKKN